MIGTTERAQTPKAEARGRAPVWWHSAAGITVSIPVGGCPADEQGKEYLSSGSERIGRGVLFLRFLASTWVMKDAWEW